MKDLKNILFEITQLTSNMETNYPELYKFLDENPMTIPASNQPDIDTEAMCGYLESLKELLKHHIKTHEHGRDSDLR